eukprot:Nk52_evm31s240 gene=Nk52_evmTU31s240
MSGVGRAEWDSYGIEIVKNKCKLREQCAQQPDTAASAYLRFFSSSIGEKVEEYHRSIPGFAPSPLHDLKCLAREVGVERVCVKDESTRLGLSAFKVLGSSYACWQMVSRMMQLEKGSRVGEEEEQANVGRFGIVENLELAALHDEENRKMFSEVVEMLKRRKDKVQLTFVSATDGNHGRGLAWTAQQLGQKCVIRMPKGSSEERLAAIRGYGADAEMTDLCYDDTVDLVKEMAVLHNENESDGRWIVVQDTAWEGYELIPMMIMQGYLTMIREALSQALGDESLTGVECPFTHVFLQAGVGSMAAAVQAYLYNVYGSSAPTVVVVEARDADCFFVSCAGQDGKARPSSGKLDTLMVGLACGVPSTIAWDVLRRHSDIFLKCSDKVTRVGMKVAATDSLGDDIHFVAGESGAVGLGLVRLLATDCDNQNLKVALGINENSSILVFSTEGATAPNLYSAILTDKV